MGSAQTKDNNNSTNNTGKRRSTSIDTKGKVNQEVQCASPLVTRALASSFIDPRSPGGRRTPVHSPRSTPPLSHKAYRDKVMTRVAGAKMDPRSPSAKRTPLHHAACDVSVGRTPPSPFTLGDPRSPFVMRTPLALSTQDAVVVPDGIVFAEEKVVAEVVVVDKPEDSSTSIAEKSEAVEKDETAEKAQQTESTSSTVSESMCVKVTTEKFSPDVTSITLMALAQSPMYSPVTKKRKDLRGPASMSPLKKSYSAPMDENTPPSPLCKSVAAVSSKPRTPLSPLCQRSVNRNSMGVQPIKFRMDPGILG